MTIPQRNSLFAVNIVVPLVFGLLIYLTKSERTILSDFYFSFFRKLPVIHYPYIIRNFACDFLWAYSLFFCLRLSLGDVLKGKHNLTVITVSGFAAVVLEMTQLINSVPGTFDPVDILVELFAVAVAFLITTIIERRFKDYEKESFG